MRTLRQLEDGSTRIRLSDAKKILLCDSSTGAQLHTLPTPANVASLAFGTHGGIISTLRNGKICVWKFQSDDRWMCVYYGFVLRDQDILHASDACAIHEHFQQGNAMKCQSVGMAGDNAHSLAVCKFQSKRSNGEMVVIACSLHDGTLLFF